MIKLNNLLNTTRNGANNLIIIADWLSDFGDKSLYAFLFKRADLKKIEQDFDVLFTDVPEGLAWAGVRLTKRGRKVLRDQTPNRYLCAVDADKLESYRNGKNELGHAGESYMCDEYNGEVLPIEQDVKCRDIRIKLGKSWIICQVKKMDTGITANVHW
jgi:hypothetical protein